MKSTLLAAMCLMWAGCHSLAQDLVQVGILGGSQEYYLTWTTEIGYNYVVELSQDLDEWVDTGIIQPGTGEDVAYGFLTPDNDHIFYRIRTTQGAILPGFGQQTHPYNDDNAVLTTIGFGINFFGTTWTEGYVSNNGNITFGHAPIDFDPIVPLHELGEEYGVPANPIMAVFWADVDTRDDVSTPDVQPDQVTYGTQAIDGHLAFGVNYVNVGYFYEHDDKLNRFQLVIVDRSYIGTGDFDVEFNYNRILWESGDFSGGNNGYGGDFPARCGLSAGNGNTSQNLELAHSAETLSLLDYDPTTELPNYDTGLVYRSRNSAVAGRFVFQFRSGQLLDPIEVSAGSDQNLPLGATSTTVTATTVDPSDEGLLFRWSILEGLTGVSVSAPMESSTPVTFPAGQRVVLQVTVVSLTDSLVSAADVMTINP